MSAEVETGAEQIELHFCHRCGISIPQIDIDTARARAVPGGFVCAGCVYQQRDAEIFADAATPAPRRAAHAHPAPASVRRDTGTRVLTVLALLYVVGTTTFLLARELTAPPPAPAAKDGVTVENLEALSRKLDVLDEQARASFADLKSNDNRQRQDLSMLSGTVNSLKQEATRNDDRLGARMEEVEGAIHALSSKTGLLKEEVQAAVREMREFGERGAATPPTDTGGGDQPTKKDPAEVKPGRSEEEMERDRLVKQYVDKLSDRNATNQTRYNAAVQLGDLKHVAAIPALVEALKSDSYDLVRRASAWSLGMFGKDAIPAVPALIAQIGGKEEYVGYMCERALGEVTKAVMGKPVTFNFDPTMTQRQRKKVQKEWETWWAKHKEQLTKE